MDASPSSPSTLQELFGAQGETMELISLLKKRLQPVSNPTPTESTDKALSQEGHIATALNIQYGVNRSLRNLIDELAI